MKLQKHSNRIIEGKEYTKWVITIPSEQVKELHWDRGADLDSTVERNKLVIKLHKGK